MVWQSSGGGWMSGFKIYGVRRTSIQSLDGNFNFFLKTINFNSSYEL